MIKKTTVLYIEDEPVQRTAISRGLRGRGYTVTAVNAGGKGVALFRKRSFDIILCDLNMPRLDGIEVLKRVRKRDSKIPFVMLTQRGGISAAVRALKLGAQDFILKPVVLHQLDTALKNAIEAARLQKELETAEDQRRMLLEYIPDIVYSLNPAGKILDVNTAATTLLGYARKRFIGTSVFHFIHPEDRPRVRRTFRKSVSEKIQSPATIEFRLQTRTGKSRHFEVNTRAVVREDRVVELTGIARNITDRKELERRIQEHARGLEKTIEERTEHLAYANRQLLALTKVSNQFTRQQSEDAIFELAPKLACHSLDFDRASLLLEKDGKLTLRSFCLEKDPAKLVRKFLKRVHDLPPHIIESYEQDRTIFIPSLNDDPRWPREHGQELIRTRAVVIAPIRANRTPIGVLVGNMQHHEREMDTQDVARFEMFANMVGLALDNVRGYKSLERKVVDRTESLRSANAELRKKATLLEQTTYQLGLANIDLLATTEKLEEKNVEMVKLFEQLSAGKDQLQAILDASPDVIVMVDEKNRIAAANKSISDFFGFSRDAVIGKNFSFFLKRIRKHFRDFDRFLRYADEMKKLFLDQPGHQHDPTEIYHRSVPMKGAPIRHVAPFFSSVSDQTGKPLGSIWIYSDITHLKQADEQLRTIVDAAPIPLIVSRISDGRILYANKHLADLLGARPEQLIGEKTPDYYEDPSSRKKLLELLNQKGRVENYEVRVRGGDGEIRWILLSGTITSLGNEHVVIAGLLDIDERKHAEEALRRERNFVSAVLETAGALVVVLDTSGKIVRFNSACEHVSGYRASEVGDRPFWEFLLVEEEVERVRKLFEKLRTGDFPMQGENFWVAKDGSKRLIEWSNTALLNDKGSVEYVVATGIDITERRAAEEALRQSEEKIRQLTDNIKEVLWLYDVETDRVLYVSPAYEEIWGRSLQSLSANPNSWVDSVHPDDIAALPEESQVANEEAYYDRPYVFRIVRPDGSIRWIRSRVFPIRDKAGNVFRTCGVNQDITDEKEAEEALRVSESKLQALLNAIPDLMFQLDAGGRILDYRDSGEMGLYASPEEFLGKKVEDALPPEIAAKTREAIGRVLHDHTIEVFEYQLPFEEQVFDYECRMVPGGDDSVLAIIRDITGAKRAQRALKNSEERFRGIVENANDIIFSLSAEGAFTYVSPKWRDILGHEISEVTGKMFEFFVHPDDCSQCRAFFEKAIESGKRQHGLTYRAKHKDGEWRWHTANISVMLADQKNLLAVIGIAHDITEQKQILDELEKANLDLRNTHAQLVQSEKMAALGALVAGVAHEINTPVSAIKSMHGTLMSAVNKLGGMVESSIDENPDYRKIQKTLGIIKESNAVIENATGRVSEIIKRLRSFARLDEAELKDADIIEGIEDTLTLIHHELKHGIEVIRDFQPVRPLACYPGQLNQVFLNIFVNARQAMNNGGTLTIRTRVVGREAIVEISDTGSGIAPQHLKKVFDPGFTTKGVGVGTGLGLSICYQIIRAHKGRIEVESALEKGSTFRIIIPTNLDELVEHT